MKKTPLRRKKPLRKVSKKTSQRLVKYYRIRGVFMKERWICEICRTNVATDIHHRKGRRGDLLFDTKWFMSLCRDCHENRVHNDVANAKKMGWLVPFWR